MQRVIIEMGQGTSLHGEDYTKAACRAVDDAIHHSSLSLFRELGIDPNSMEVVVTIGVQQPDKVDAERVRAVFPYGKIRVEVVKGGLDVPYPERGDPTVVASAAVAAYADLSAFRPA